MYINKQSNIQKKDLVSTKTASGNPVVITDCAGGKARSLITEINAIQDLHGYDKPWVGGAGKNKLNLYALTTSIINGVTFTVSMSNDGSLLYIEADGTASANADFTQNITGQLINNTAYYYSGCTGGASDTYKMQIIKNDDNASVADVFNGESTAFQLDGTETTVRFRIRVYSGKTVNHAMFYPMVRLQTVADATYAPYSNICPISGRTAVVLTRSDGDEISEDFTIQLGTTVYGADINWDTGVMTVKTALVDMGNNSFSWNYHNSLGLFYGNLPSNAAEVKVGGQNGLSSAFKCVNSSQPQNGEFTMLNYTFGVNKTIWVHDERYTDPTEFKTAVTGQTVTYPIATPITIQLTPTQLEMLKGYNRVTIESGTITLDYIPDNLAGDIISLVEEDYVKLEDVNTDPISVSGNPIVIQDAAAIKARSLITEINAIQDLHGLPFPYVGGAYKNKLPMTVSAIKAANTSGTWSGNVYTINGGTITILTDSDGNVTGFKVNGTFNDAVNFYVTPTNMSLESNGMIYSGITSGSGSTYFLYFDGAGVEVQTSEVTITTGRNPITMARIVIRSGAVLNNVLFYPMVRPSTESDASFAPYSNICPISGRTEAVITRSDGDEISEDFTIQLGQTVYGAEINWDTGVMTVKTQRIAFDGSEAWTASNGSVTACMRVESPVISNAEKNSANDHLMGLISNMFKEKTPNQTYMGGESNIGFCMGMDGKISVCQTGSKNMVVADWKTWLATNPLQVEYELATPTTIQLTPTQLEMLKGYNRITLSDGYGTIELSYQRDNISGDIASLVENELSVKADNSDISNNFELGSTASKAYSINQFMLREDGLYKVTANIASGAEITSSNTTKVTITEVLTALLNA